MSFNDRLILPDAPRRNHQSSPRVVMVYSGGMTRSVSWLVFLFGSIAAGGALSFAQQSAPHWAYGYSKPPAAGESAPRESEWL